MFEMCRHSVDGTLVCSNEFMAFDAALVPRSQGNSFVDRDPLPASGARHLANRAQGHGKMISLSRKNVKCAAPAS